MATTSGIRGMLLEEAVLRLIAASGYKAVFYDKAKPDPTLDEDKGALFVLGRGERHQIDALADFFLLPPFSHQLRLLIEAKCRIKAVDLTVIRNAVGVLKDVSEFWPVPTISSKRRRSPQAIPGRRYHYQCAVISMSGFTKEAQHYAFAHDIFLISLAHAAYFQGVRNSLEAITPSIFGVERASDTLDIASPELRQAIRRKLIDAEDSSLSTIHMPSDARDLLANFCQACRNVKMAVVATLEKQFPFFLLPHTDRVIELAGRARSQAIVDLGQVRLRRDRQEGWIIEYRGQQFFSFDIPQHLLELYLQHLPPGSEDALEMEAVIMNMAKYVNNNLDDSTHIIKFQCSRSELQRLVQGTLW